MILLNYCGLWPHSDVYLYYDISGVGSAAVLRQLVAIILTYSLLFQD
jgi:hypothetical protein